MFEAIVLILVVFPKLIPARTFDAMAFREIRLLLDPESSMMPYLAFVREFSLIRYKHPDRRSIPQFVAPAAAFDPMIVLAMISPPELVAAKIWGPRFVASVL
jgi:hypothetical protein